jgi:two-component system NtrC family sensor kinase
MHAQIKIITEARGQNARIIIQDNGPGIPEENLRKIFDPFFTTKDVGKGTGLGLSLCYGIVREHGGTITPSNAPGGGARFTIELPAMQMSAVGTELPGPVETNGIDLHEGSGKKILVIDDEEILLEMLREELTRFGYGVDIACDGGTALQRLQKNNYDVMLCDWKMPGLNGRRIYEDLKTSELRRRVIFISGDVVNEQMRQFLEQEKRPCLAKPFTFAEVRKAIQTVMAA